MATDGKDHAVEGPARVRTAALQGPGRPPVVGKDPAVLAADIERTREELAGTLAAIADRVSPKQVAKRTRQKVGASVKETAGKAEEKLKTGTAAAVETVKGAADAVKETVSGQGSRVGQGTRLGQAAPGPVRVAPAAHLADEPHVAVSSTSERVVPAPNPLSQGTVTIPVSSAGALPAATPTYRPAPASKLPIYAGAAAAVAVVLLLLRRRRR